MSFSLTLFYHFTRNKTSQPFIKPKKSLFVTTFPFIECQKKSPCIKTVGLYYWGVRFHGDVCSCLVSWPNICSEVTHGQKRISKIKSRASDKASGRGWGPMRFFWQESLWADLKQVQREDHQVQVQTPEVGQSFREICVIDCSGISLHQVNNISGN